MREHRPKFILLPEAEGWQNEVSQPSNKGLAGQVLAGYRDVDTRHGSQWYVPDKP
ncbi:unnamed protein product [marine sediment metagenome]|uniref:Uncharacterized protein n=1 Tax=marine sediment metagenome TaxID=412755 RepID=X1PGX6_9ZZZZ